MYHSAKEEEECLVVQGNIWDMTYEVAFFLLVLGHGYISIFEGVKKK